MERETFNRKQRKHFFWILWSLASLGGLPTVVCQFNRQCSDTTNNVSGECSRINNCPALHSLVKEARRSAAAIARLKTYLTCGSVPNICCPKTTAENPNNNNPNSFQKLIELLPKQCGEKKSLRIAGGTDSQPGEWPWLVALGEKTSDVFVPLCGGTIITKKHILTAAHCLLQVSSRLIARVGDFDLKRTDDASSPQEFLINNFRKANFRLTNFENDIAIIILDRDLNFNDYIQPICLPFKLNDDLAGQDLHIAGWGQTDTTTFSWIPKKASVPVLSISQCQSIYAPLFARSSFKITDKQTCAGLGPQDSCKGDSGGPLMQVNENGKYVIRGIVSYGAKSCGNSQFPGVYTTVTSWLAWIVQNII